MCLEIKENDKSLQHDEHEVVYQSNWVVNNFSQHLLVLMAYCNLTIQHLVILHYTIFGVVMLQIGCN